MSKNSKKIFLALALMALLLPNNSEVAIENENQLPNNQDQTINAISLKEDYKNVEENIDPTKIYIYGIDLIEYYMIKDSSLTKDLGMYFWTTNVGRLSANYTQRLYFTTKPIIQEVADRYELYKYFIFLGDMPAPLFVAHEHIEGYPSVYYVTNNPNKIVDRLLPIINSDSKIYLAYDTNAKEKYLVSSSDAIKIKAGEIPGQELIDLYGRDLAYKDMLDDVFDDMSIFNSLSLEKYRNDKSPEIEDFCDEFKQIYNSRA